MLVLLIKNRGGDAALWTLHILKLNMQIYEQAPSMISAAKSVGAKKT